MPLNETPPMKSFCVLHCLHTNRKEVVVHAEAPKTTYLFAGC